MSKERMVTGVLYGAIDDVKKLQPPEQALKKSMDTVLFGAGGALDSLGMVNFIRAVEQRLEREFGVAVTLVHERAMSKKNSPFKTIGSLHKYILGLLNGR